MCVCVCVCNGNWSDICVYKKYATTSTRMQTARSGSMWSVLVFVHAWRWVGDNLHAFVARGLLHCLDPLTAIVLQIIMYVESKQSEHVATRGWPKRQYTNLPVHCSNCTELRLALGSQARVGEWDDGIQNTHAHTSRLAGHTGSWFRADGCHASGRVVTAVSNLAAVPAVAITRILSMHGIGQYLRGCHDP